MLPRVFLSILLIASCRSGPQLPSELTRACERSNAESPLRLQLDGDEIVAWTTPIAGSDLPRPVEKAARALLPGGEPRRVEKTVRGEATEFVIVSDYATDPHPGSRTMRLDPDGRVLERSHVLEMPDLPAPLSGLVDEFPGLQHVEFVQGRGPDRYRFTSIAPDATILRIDYLADGTEHGGSEVRSIEVESAKSSQR